LGIAITLIVAGCTPSQEATGGADVTPGVERDPSPSTKASGSAVDVSVGVLITPAESLDLDQYGEFTFQSASAVGLAPNALEQANQELARMSEPWIAEAVAENETQECLEGEERCGFFSLSLNWLPCDENLLCVQQVIDKVGVGMAISAPEVSAVRLDPSTGSNVTLDAFLGPESLADFLAALNETTSLVQRLNDSFFEDSPPNYDEESMPAWIPENGGIKVWYPKYEVGPGFLGIVEARFLPTSNGWASWVTQEGEEIPILEVSDGVDVPSGKQGVSPASDMVLVQVLSDLEWDLDPTWCRQVRLANGNPNWGVLDESSEAFDNPEMCVLSDSFSYVGKVNGKWRVLDYAGSDVDTCTVMREGLSAEGMPENAIEDFISEWGCLSDDEFGDIVDPSQEYEEPPAESVQQQPTVDLVEVPQIVGLFNKDAERALGRAGLGSMIQPQIGDPSIAAQTSNQCVVTSQNPVAGSQAERGSTVMAQMQCPNTGYNAPAAPQPWSG